MVTPDEWPLRRRFVFARQNPAYRPAGINLDDHGTVDEMHYVALAQALKGAQSRPQAVYKPRVQWISPASTLAVIRPPTLTLKSASRWLFERMFLVSAYPSKLLNGAQSQSPPDGDAPNLAYRSPR